MGKSQRQKGYRGEHNLVKKLKEAGVPAQRVPLSGASEFQKGDVIVDGKVAEVKVRKDDFKRIYQWLEDKDLLFIKSDRKDYLVVMKLDDFIKQVQLIRWMLPTLWKRFEDFLRGCEGANNLIERMYHHWDNYTARKDTRNLMITARTLVYLYWSCPGIEHPVLLKVEETVKEALKRRAEKQDITSACKFRYKGSCLFAQTCKNETCPLLSESWRQLGIKLREIIIPERAKELIP